MYERPSSYHRGTPAIARFGPESQRKLNPRMEPSWVWFKEYMLLGKVSLQVIDRYFVRYEEHKQYGFEYRNLATSYWDSEEAIEMLSLQCEACGPDLELYEMMRRRQ